MNSKSQTDICSNCGRETPLIRLPHKIGDIVNNTCIHCNTKTTLILIHKPIKPKPKPMSIKNIRIDIDVLIYLTILALGIRYIIIHHILK